MKSIIYNMRNNGFLTHLLKKWKPSCHGPHTLGFPPPSDLPPMQSAFFSQASYTSYHCVVWLGEHELILLQITLFTHEGVQTNSNDDFPSIIWGILLRFSLCMGLLTHLFSSYMKSAKNNIPIYYMKNLEYYKHGRHQILYGFGQLLSAIYWRFFKYFFPN